MASKRFRVGVESASAPDRDGGGDGANGPESVGRRVSLAAQLAHLVRCEREWSPTEGDAVLKLLAADRRLLRATMRSFGRHQTSEKACALAARVIRLCDAALSPEAALAPTPTTLAIPRPRLPTALWTLVASWCDQLDKCRLVLVSRAFFVTARSPAAWTHLELSKSLQLDSFARVFPDAARQARSVALTWADAQLFRKCIDYAAPPACESKRLTDLNCRAKEACTRPNPHLRELRLELYSLSVEQLALVADTFPRLESLHLRVMYGTYDERFDMTRIVFERFLCLRVFRDDWPSVRNPQSLSIAVPPHLVRLCHRGPVLLDVRAPVGDSGADESIGDDPSSCAASSSATANVDGISVLRTLELTDGAHLATDPTALLAAASNLVDLVYTSIGMERHHSNAVLQRLALHPSLTRLCIGVLPSVAHDAVAFWAAQPRPNLVALRVERVSSPIETAPLAYLAAFPNLGELCLDAMPNGMPNGLTVDALLELIGKTPAATARRLRLLRLPVKASGPWFQPPRRRSPTDTFDDDAAVDATLWLGYDYTCVMAVVGDNRRPVSSRIDDPAAATSRFENADADLVVPSTSSSPVRSYRSLHATDVTFGNVIRVVFDASRRSPAPVALCRLLVDGCVVTFGCVHREPSGFRVSEREARTNDAIGTFCAAAADACLCRKEVSRWHKPRNTHGIRLREIPDAVYAL